MTSKQRILEAIKQSPNATYAKIAEACNMSVTNVAHHLDGLIEQGKVRIRDKWEVL